MERVTASLNPTATSCIDLYSLSYNVRNAPLAFDVGNEPTEIQKVYQNQ